MGTDGSPTGLCDRNSAAPGPTGADFVTGRGGSPNAMEWFQDHAVLFALLCAGAAVAYGLWLTAWLLRRPAGNERMQEIARAVQEGAAAYLRRQYTTVAIVAIAPFLLLGFYDKLGWGTAVGFLIGA